MIRIRCTAKPRFILTQSHYQGGMGMSRSPLKVDGGRRIILRDL
jgi:hypothetical protein